jgi:hypothetical protein
MNLAINLYCQPTPRMSGQVGLPLWLQVDEAMRPQGDEAGNVLTPDPEVIALHADENQNPLADENGAANIPEP